VFLARPTVLWLFRRVKSLISSTSCPVRILRIPPVPTNLKFFKRRQSSLTSPDWGFSLSALSFYRDVRPPIFEAQISASRTVRSRCFFSGRGDPADPFLTDSNVKDEPGPPPLPPLETWPPNETLTIRNAYFSLSLTSLTRASRFAGGLLHLFRFPPL